MSKVCQICNKGFLKGNKVPRGIGNRVLSRTIIRKMANLRNKRFLIDGRSIKVTLCTSCLKRIKFDSKKAEAALKSEAN